MSVRRLLVLGLSCCLSVLAVLLPARALAANTTTTPYIEAPGTSPSVDTIQDGASTNAPWNSSQGVGTFDTLTITPYPAAALEPTFSFSGQSTSSTPATNGSTIEPNVAVYPSEAGTEPFPSGFAGSPGPLSGYCGSSYSDTWNSAMSNTTASPNQGQTPVSQPAGASLPFAPYYFPYVVRNSDGSLTGYFDWRPKDGDEAIVSATSSDNGKTWTATGQALEQNPGYCPSGDTNDDGEGHPYVTTLGTNPALYTLQRAAGDNAGIGLLEHPLSGASVSGVPAKESVGVDPNTFAMTGVGVSGSATTISVSTLGGDGSGSGANSTSLTDAGGTSLTIPDANAITAGPFIDVTAEAADSLTPANATVTCTGVSGTSAASPALTGCTAPGAGFQVAAGDNLEQVIGTVASTSNNNVIPATGQNEKQSGGLAKLNLTNATANSSETLFMLNNNAPDRYYVDGVTVYCAQANADPTTIIENCTNTSGSPVTVHTGDAVLADPVTPAASTGGPTTSTNGLLAPDGIDGTLPSSANAAWGVASNAKVVLYTEKLLQYYNVGGINGTITAANAAATTAATVNLPGATPTDYNISPQPDQTEQLPNTGSFSVYVVPNNATTVTTLTCTGWNVDTNAANPDRYSAVSNSIDLIGCTGGSATQTIAAGHQGQWIGGPGAAIEPYGVLSQTGEGKNNQEKLLGNNEDYEVIRAASTTDGIHFTDLGAISGSTSGTGSTDGVYTDISNPAQQFSPAGPTGTSLDGNNPQGVAPTNGAVGSRDDVELRWPGARGTIVNNADGSIGMFLSGAWGSDGDSDAFNQIFYTASTDGGKTWSVPRIIQTTDYTFSASAAQDTAELNGSTPALGVSAYYSGRVYDPTVVANNDGTLTMVFSGYRLPSPVKAAGTPLGTNSSALYCSGLVPAAGGCAAGTDTVTETDPALYRNILTETLWPNIGNLQAPTVSTGAASAVTGSAASIAGTVQTNEPDTTASVVYGTSATNLSQSAGAGSVNGSTSAQNVTGALSGLASGTTYYYAVQASNNSGTTTGSVQSFTTTGSGPATNPPPTTTVTTPGPTVTTPGATVTTPGSTVTTPGSTVTTPGRTVTTPATVTQTSTKGEFTTASAHSGNQTITVEVPNTAICLTSAAKLKAAYQTVAVAGSHATKLTFVHATVSIDSKVRATFTRASESSELSLKGLKRGTHTLKVVSTFHYKSGKKTKTATRTQTIHFKVC